jgi:alginate O-acetyltransferase complex protein AlgI
VLYNSTAFIWFLAIVLSLYYILPKAHTKYLILTVSYVFYGWWNYKFLGLILGSTVVNYSVAILFNEQTQEKWRKYLLLFNLVFNIGLLGIFKYFNFFSQSLSEILSCIGLHRNYVPVNILLPLGISFFTFQTISYTIDVYNRKLSPEKDFIVFASFIAFFPKVVSGPIERAGDLMPQIRQKPPIHRGYLTEGIWLMLWGYFLKVFMADNLGNIVDSMYSNYKTISGADVIMCNYIYAYQIFGDFAGYSYIAIGVARLFGVTLNDNFRFPYFVKTPSEFWKNWHISLSSWLRDYLYIPLGGSRCSRILTYRNLFITMTLAGLWHGAAWHFILWGIYQGIMLISFNVFSKKASTISTMSLKSATQIFIMFNITCVGWMIFRTPNMEVFSAMINHIIFDFSKVTYRTFYWGISFLFFISVPFTILFSQFMHKKALSFPFKTSISRVSCYMVMIFLLLVMGNWGTNQFIYLQF